MVHVHLPIYVHLPVHFSIEIKQHEGNYVPESWILLEYFPTNTSSGHNLRSKLMWLRSWAEGQRVFWFWGSRVGFVLNGLEGNTFRCPPNRKGDCASAIQHAPTIMLKLIQKQLRFNHYSLFSATALCLVPAAWCRKEEEIFSMAKFQPVRKPVYFSDISKVTFLRNISKVLCERRLI